jgi:tetratricopeptide (TPR) repeat protein
MSTEKRLNLFICLFLALATAAVFAPALSHPFINYDDRQYILENANVTAGLTLHNVIWAFTSFSEANWHPLTWLSHMLDVELYGLNPSGHHLTSILLHMATTLLLYLFLHRATSSPWRSALVAALFALHPLRIESVAWVAERKDVLSAFFAMATLLAYARYARNPAPAGYLLVVGCFTLGLLSKPMLVTLPCLMLLLDYWPLGRWQRSEPVRLIVEKLPLLTLTAASCWVTYTAQHSGISNPSLPLQLKLANGAVAYATYLARMIWPAKLAILYPFDQSIPAGKVTSAVVLLSLISWQSLRLRRKYPWFTVGWFWYLGTLVPVIGLINVGYQATADRYTYLPLTGIFIVIAWGLTEFAETGPVRQKSVTILCAIALCTLAAVSRWQLSYWQSSVRLFTRAIEVTEKNYIAWNNMGAALQLEGKDNEALNAYEQSLAIHRFQAPPHNNIGLILAKQGRLGEAVSHYLTALSIEPGYSEAGCNLGRARLLQGDYRGAVLAFAGSAKLTIEDESVLSSFAGGLQLIRGGHYREAIAGFDALIKKEPGKAGDYGRLGGLLITYGQAR